MGKKGDILPIESMQAMAERTVLTSRLYSRDTDAGEKIAAIVGRLAAELALGPKKIDLRDYELVQQVCIAYAESCARAGAIPSKIGLARAMGISRNSLDYFLSHHREEPSAEYLALVLDSFAEALNAASLSNSCHPIVGIFLSKALYGYRDDQKEPEPLDNTPDPLGESIDEQTIRDKYADLLDELPD